MYGKMHPESRSKGCFAALFDRREFHQHWPCAYLCNPKKLTHPSARRDWPPPPSHPRETIMADMNCFPSGSDLHDRIQEALRSFDESVMDSPLADLFLFRRLRGTRTLSSHQITNRIMLDLLAKLETENAHYGQILRKRFIDGKNMAAASQELMASDSTAFRWQREAIMRMAELLIEAEAGARTELQARFLSRLSPPTNNKLFGITPHLDRLMEWVSATDVPWLVLVEGMGGIGKTTVTDAFVRQAIEQYLFDDFAWVSAKADQLSLVGEIQPVQGAALSPTALLAQLARQLLPLEDIPTPFVYEQGLRLVKSHLAHVPSLVVVDNLETLADLEALLPTLIALSNPSKLLLTSRKSLDHLPQIFPYRLPALEEVDALALVRHEATARNLPDLVAASDETLHPIFETVGGNPLALRLVVGQTTVHALPDVLDALRLARGRTVEQLYTFIYRQAWENLDETARLTLLSMPLVPAEGGNLAFIHSVSALGPDQLMDALARLVRLNLVDHRRDSLQRSRYTIHSLTRTFLHEQVAKW